ncbi:MAG: hypothetical protein A2231_01545 [Candidatus Firestonebacteria bacterium RIFOXYA2_FULL_40_8]|nr:MAG: hypothetical protein A2231_01545 [Candidatus Firestonebacteria bacterium RIFOXYA2_FULL_40_8]
MRLDEFLARPAVNTARNIVPMLKSARKAMRLDDFIAGNINQSIPAATSAVREAATLPMQRPERFVQQPVVRGVDTIAGNLALSMPISKAMTNAATGKGLLETMARSRKPEFAQELAMAGLFGKSEIKTVFRGDKLPVSMKHYDVSAGIKAGKELGGAFAEGPGIYFTTDLKNAKTYGQNITQRDIDIGNFVSKKTPILSKSKIESILGNIDEETMATALSNFDENPNNARKMLVDAIMNADNAHDQLINIWADVFYHQQPEKYMQAVAQTGIKGFEVPKEGGAAHYVVFDKDVLKTIGTTPGLLPQADKLKIFIQNQREALAKVGGNSAGVEKLLREHPEISPELRALGEKKGYEVLPEELENRVREIIKSREQISIPKLNSTEDAIEFGRKNLGDKDAIETLRKLYENKVKEANTYDVANATTADKNKIIRLHYEAQLYREAMFEAQGKDIAKSLREKGLLK